MRSKTNEVLAPQYGISSDCRTETERIEFIDFNNNAKVYDELPGASTDGKSVTFTTTKTSL